MGEKQLRMLFVGKEGYIGALIALESEDGIPEFDNLGCLIEVDGEVGLA